MQPKRENNTATDYQRLGFTTSVTAQRYRGRSFINSQDVRVMSIPA